MRLDYPFLFLTVFYRVSSWRLVPCQHYKLVSDECTDPLSDGMERLLAAGHEIVEMKLQPGELLLIPSGWYHEVRIYLLL